MDDLKGPHLIKYLLSQEASQVLEWMRTLETGNPPAQRVVIWLGLGELAGEMAHGVGYRGVPQLDWAEVALAAYANQDRWNTPDMFDRAPRLRAWMIERLGAVQGHPVLDPALLERWFLHTVPIPIREAEHLLASQSRAELGREIDSALGSTGRRLSLLARLVELGRMEPSPELARWLALQEKLR